MYEKESAVESKAMGGGANTFMDESFQGYPHLLDEETGKFSRSTTPGLRVYYPGTMRPIGIGSKLFKPILDLAKMAGRLRRAFKNPKKGEEESDS
jgi:hypothetical protein